MMAISILYTQPRADDVSTVSSRILYHLSLDRSFSYICTDVKKRERFLSTVSQLTDCREDIVYRQEIGRDFADHPALLERFLSLCARFEELRAMQRTAGKEEYRMRVTGTESSASSKNILGAQALCLKRALLFVKAYGDLLAEFDVQSRGLKTLYAACKETCECSAFSGLLTFCSKYENFSERGFWDFRFSLNEEGRIEEYALVDHKYVHVTDPELKKKGFSLFKRAEEPSYPCARLQPSRDGLFEGLASAALNDLSGLFGSLCEQIFERYGLIGRELVFYEVAHKYRCALEAKQVPLCYPTFTSDQSVSVEHLYDLYLLMSMPRAANVIPNDVRMEKGSGGLLVYGHNGSGKTVYLRSIGTMQLLAQAGLPIPCERAELALFSQLASQFSESEKEFCKGNDAGRFEQEVRELAAMVDDLKAGSLVFLNETFQSTAYAEGAEGLSHLLKHFSRCGIRWILVTHLRQLEKMLAPEEATVMHTAEGYHIVR